MRTLPPANEDRHVDLYVILRYAAPRRVAHMDFVDQDYPEMFRVPGRANVVAADTLDAVAAALEEHALP